MKKAYKGIVESDIIRLDKKTTLPFGTHAVITLKTVIKKEEQHKIKERQLELLNKGFDLGEKLYSSREDLYDR
ncbi:hypothetical protein [Candidatus Magnetomonas plexicatena]|uniref:hypothetical protein n=1 Tax=Candidatus Magnetomonas plexicatena TaxID=2552947 RepID=UPI0011031DB0|nr:hypothetical protein E2O03_001430 [Nitrospirales bacterium LBB_01]